MQNIYIYFWSVYSGLIKEDCNSIFFIIFIDLFCQKMSDYIYIYIFLLNLSKYVILILPNYFCLIRKDYNPIFCIQMDKLK